MRPSLARTPATLVLLAAIGAMFVVETLAGGSTRTDVLVRLGANVPELVWRGQWWRLVACMFLHIGIAHLLLNGWALFQLGTLFELWLGSVRLLTVYFLTGVAGSLASLFWTSAVSAGASAAIFGLLGALIAFLLRRRSALTPTAKSLLLQLAFWAVINVVFGLRTPGIDNAAHFGGGLAGFLVGLGLRPEHERRSSG